jgi:hypothetical protein
MVVAVEADDGSTRHGRDCSSPAQLSVDAHGDVAPRALALGVFAVVAAAAVPVVVTLEEAHASLLIYGVSNPMRV